jgi:hypothetical protein
MYVWMYGSTAIAIMPNYSLNLVHFMTHLFLHISYDFSLSLALLFRGVVDQAKGLLSIKHVGAKIEHIWGDGDGRPVDELKGGCELYLCLYVCIYIYIS